MFLDYWSLGCRGLGFIRARALFESQAFREGIVRVSQ